MRVRMLVTVSGTRDGMPWPSAGEDWDVDAGDAAQLLAAGLAIEVAPPVETATAPAAPEKAARVKSE